ncbi:malonate decarboxylase subunit delta [Lysinibacillus sphaericus]|uniref:malonate decarboxylase subunit delta n=1 Tax=Lysinibacillus sphaericus TaxID=1421 RepID=UPI000C18E131|nr:malonate decarboxylase subunit delta [Lysinibacillus sphaericus]MBG9755836.1 malonate decarboxylase subunit delta [Lysinibacillus sphaericus]PIJ99947.1 malonate decarboxylase acyl carrier protein [Lysinibacillus sphaericus]QTB14768.1 malonate decarboxylase subunit delta [Lysinibacillus sphaericus]
MEKLIYSFPASKVLENRVHVGVVGSGDLEVLVEPTNAQETVVEIRTGITGYSETWRQVIERFFSQNDVSAHITINDFGATPGVVSIRLAQALEVSKNA